MFDAAVFTASNRIQEQKSVQRGENCHIEQNTLKTCNERMFDMDTFTTMKNVKPVGKSFEHIKVM